MAERALAEIGICFMMAPMHHPATRHVMPVRGELGTRTLFNILGPLTNPAGVRRQLTGAYRPCPPAPDGRGAGRARLAGGLARAWRGRDRRDLHRRADLGRRALRTGPWTERTVTPEDAGLPTHPFEAILGGEPAENARAFRALLDGATGAYRDAVLLNAAAALIVAGRVADLPEGVALAAASIDGGAAAASSRRWRT